MPHDQDPIEARVARGASHLDAHLPGWERRIDLATLDLADSCRCVLGQLYGGRKELAHSVDIMAPCSPYGHGSICIPYELGIHSDDFAVDHGFEANTASYPEYRALDEAWIALIKARFESGAFSDA